VVRREYSSGSNGLDAAEVN